MAERELYELYDKIKDTLYGFKSYHCWYYCCNEKFENNSLSFEVHVTSDQDEGSEWIEYWSIDDKGKIHSENAIYENYEEILREW